MIVLRLLLHDVFGLFSCIFKILRVQRCPDSFESGLVRHPPKLISSLLSCNGVLEWTSVGGGAGSGGGLSKPGPHSRQLTEAIDLHFVPVKTFHGWNSFPQVHILFLTTLENVQFFPVIVHGFSEKKDAYTIIKRWYFNRYGPRSTDYQVHKHINRNSSCMQPGSVFIGHDQPTII